VDGALRGIAIFLEVLVLTAILYCILNAVRLAAFDFGIAQKKYNRPIVLILTAAGIILVIFFTTHLSLFYPSF
jgi:succinate dehydrogenase/fumarate reductase cytochrome b subunit